MVGMPAARPARTGPARAAGRAAAAPFRSAAWLATAYLATGYVLATASFVVLLTLTIVSGPFMILALAGLPILWFALTLAHGVAHVERWRAATYLGADLRVRSVPPSDRSLPRRLVDRVRTRGAWLELLYGLVLLPMTAWFGAALTAFAWGGALAFLLFPAYGWVTTGGPGVLSWGIPYVASVLLHVVAGLALLLAAPWIARGAAGLNLAAAHLLLTPTDTEQLHLRVETLQDTRSRMVDAADAERRRIERDLHDGAQQRLVSVAMTLGRARGRFDDDPTATRELLDQAHAEAKRALGDLRDLARGIHPAILTDRGLDAALSALASACPVPVEVTVEVSPRVPKAIEAVAYFVVAESLTNVAKHSAAGRAWVSARRTGETLVVQIIDDGTGGADASSGSGLEGLRNRVQAVDGTFVVISPLGGVTTIYAELPCAS